MCSVFIKMLFLFGDPRDARVVWKCWDTRKHTGGPNDCARGSDVKYDAASHIFVARVHTPRAKGARAREAHLPLLTET